MWQLLIASIGGSNNALRVRLWRQLNSAGAAALRDGVYLLPASSGAVGVFDSWQKEIQQAGGEAYIVEVPSQPTLDPMWRNLFARSDEYQKWAADLQALIAAPPSSEADARRQLRRLRKDLDALIAIDFFPGTAGEQAERAFQNGERQLVRHFSPDEPVPADGIIERRALVNFQGRCWATRARPWVDRIASAWLIRRFIDTNAQFLWLTDMAACPPAALGFDFDGATFTHVGDRVTFEVLLASFGLDNNSALMRLGTMVHALDVDGESPPEAAGFEALLAGARARLQDDDALLQEISSVLDSLYVYFQSEKRDARGRR